MKDRVSRPFISLFFYVAAEGMEPITLDDKAFRAAVQEDAEAQLIMSGSSAPFGK